ncbi:hypothetical protein Q8F55_000604 [Vanrija albida]|uniref:SH3 domain-containing protein n=1 Tax=Vanrija albida TaxID=181172 RepID=A0ABR3QDR5_9TREE
MPRNPPRRRLGAFAAAAAAATLVTTPSVLAASPAPPQVPNVDFARMGSVGFGGAFAGLDWFTAQSAFASSSSSSGSTPHFAADGGTLLVQNPDGSISLLGNTNPGGSITALCYSNSPDNGTLYIGGTFTSFASTSSSNIVAYSLSSAKFTALGTGLSGPVNTLYCDDPHQEVWAGGAFSDPSASSTPGNVARWSTQSSAWSAVPFGGLNGQVRSIAPSPNNGSLYFGGDFTTQYASNGGSRNVTTNTTIISVPNAPVDTVTTGNSGYLTPFTIPQSASQYGGLTIDATPAAPGSDANALLCPGTGSWQAQSGSTAVINILSYGYLRGQGVRVANDISGGSGTTSFTLTTLPDNTVVPLTYTDPATGQNQTCTSSCPLSTNSSVHAQDFLFEGGSRELTGLQFTLDGHQGSQAALDYIQLLSDGAYASAVESDNTGLCGGSKSSVQSIGSWQDENSPTSIPGTTSGYTVAEVPTNAVTETSLTLYTWVGSTGYYDMFLVVPGCAQIGDCAGRTTVDVTVFAQDGVPFVTTVDQNVQEDSLLRIYSGLVDASTDAFSPTITVSLPSNPAPIAGDNYVVVANGVSMTLTGLQTAPLNSTTTVTGATATGTSVSPATTSGVLLPNTTRAAFGVFEWARNSDLKATSLLPNNTQTALTQLAFSLDAARNASGGTAFSVASVLPVNNTAFVSGSFSASNYSNVVAVDTATGAPIGLPNQGLNGAVNAAAVVSGLIYFGGNFTGTQTSNSDLSYLARYDPVTKAWDSVGGGVDGPVTELLGVPGGLVVVGPFNHVIFSNGSSFATGGYAVYNATTSQWNTGGILYGNGTAIGSSGQHTYVAGQFVGASSNSVGGVASLVTNKDGTASIESLKGVSFSNAGSAPPPAAAPARRSLTGWLAHVARSNAHIVARAPALPIPARPALAPATLTGAFYTNSSADGKPDITILGGNFTQGSGPTEVSGVAFQTDNAPMSGPHPPVSGIVRALNVDKDTLYVGGSDITVNGIGGGLLRYDLAHGRWINAGMPALAVNAGSNIAINQIKTRHNTDMILVAGNFANAGSLSCPALCIWRTQTERWEQAGLGSGEVTAIDFGDDQYGTLVAGGSFVINSDNVYAATYHFANTSWTPLPGLPGPVTSIVFNDRNASNIFATGFSASDRTPYLQQWDGRTWTNQNSSALLDGTVIQNLAFVPVKHEHSAEGPIEKNRMLMASGEVFLANTGNVSSALFDGASWYPYLIGSTAAGTLGAASSLFWKNTSIDFSLRKYLDRGIVVLVAMAIATGIILLLILLILLVAYCLRLRERRQQPAEVYDKDGSDVSSTHQFMLNSVQTALERSLIPGAQHPSQPERAHVSEFGAGPSTLAGAGAVGAGAAAGLGVASATQLSAGSGTHLSAPTYGSRPESDQSHYVDAEQGPEYLHDNQPGSYEGSDEGRETIMRYDFFGPELQTGELPMRTGQRIIILDDEQSDEWWYARDPATGQEGVVPATYGDSTGWGKEVPARWWGEAAECVERVVSRSPPRHSASGIS